MNKRRYSEIELTHIREAVDKALAEGHTITSTIYTLLAEWEGLPTTYKGIDMQVKKLRRWPWGIKEYLESDGSKPIPWCLKEDLLLKRKYEKKPGVVPAEWFKTLALALHEVNPTVKRSYGAIMDRVYSTGLSKKGNNIQYKIKHTELAKLGLKVEDGYEHKGNSGGRLPLEGIACGHKFTRQVRLATQGSCPVCAGTHRPFYSEEYFKSHPEDKLTPCYIYLASFLLQGFCKPGLTEEGNEERRFATYAHLKPEIKCLRLLTKYEVFKLECLFQEKFLNYLTFSEELKGNGSTECFDISIEAEIIKIIDEYESGTFK